MRKSKTILTIEKTKKQQFKVDLHEHNGQLFVGARVWYRVAGGAWTPSQHGLSVRIEHAQAVAEGILAAVADAKEAM